MVRNMMLNGTIHGFSGKCYPVDITRNCNHSVWCVIILGLSIPLVAPFI